MGIGSVVKEAATTIGKKAKYGVDYSINLAGLVGDSVDETLVSKTSKVGNKLTDFLDDKSFKFHDNIEMGAFEAFKQGKLSEEEFDNFVSELDKKFNRTQARNNRIGKTLSSGIQGSVYGAAGGAVIGGISGGIDEDETFIGGALKGAGVGATAGALYGGAVGAYYGTSSLTQGSVALGKTIKDGVTDTYHEVSEKIAKKRFESYKG